MKLTAGTFQRDRTDDPMPFGASVRKDGGVGFRLFAPAVDQVVLEHAALDDFTAHPMLRDGAG